MNQGCYEWMLEQRGVETPCQKCKGTGIISYPSTATWRGGWGGSSITKDTCDKCWGTGDKDNHGSNLRDLIDFKENWKKEQVFYFLSAYLGITIETIRNRFLQLSELAEKQSQKRKLPEGEEEFWWVHDWKSISSILKELCSKLPG